MCVATDLIAEFARDVKLNAYRLRLSAPRVVDVDDLHQEANFALFRCAEKVSQLTNLDLRRNYVQLRIRGSMLDYIRRQYPTRTDRKNADGEKREAVYVTSLDSLLTLDGALNRSLDDLLPTTSADPTMEHAQLVQGLQKISENQRWAELLSYMLNGLTLLECGVAMGISEARACQIKSEILETLRRYC